MAKYGDQQNLSIESLSKFGILGELMPSMESKHGVRFISPIEMLLCLGCSGAVAIPSNNRLAWHIFGNAIHEFHAFTGLLTVWNFKQHAFKKPQIQLQEALIRHQEQCWIASKIVVREDEECPGLFHVLCHDGECEIDESSNSCMIDNTWKHEGTESETQKRPCVEEQDTQNKKQRTIDSEHDPSSGLEVHMATTFRTAEHQAIELQNKNHPSFIQVLHKAMKEGILATQIDSQGSDCGRSKETLPEETPCIQDKSMSDEPDDWSPLSFVMDLVAIQVKNMHTLQMDMEIFWTTPDQTVGDRIAGRVTMEGTNIQFDAPRIKNRIVSVSEKLFQLGEILRMTYREVKRDVEGFVIVTLMEEGDFVAQMTGKPGFGNFSLLTILSL